MSIIDFKEKSCSRIRQLIDSYMDNELLVETNHEVLKHLAVCVECSRALDEKSRLKGRLREAVSATSVPDNMAESIMQNIRTERPAARWGDLRHWSLAVAATLVLAVGAVLMVRSPQGDPVATTGTAGGGVFQKISAEAREILRVGVLDHIHCTLELGRWKTFLSFESMQKATGRRALGKEFIDLVPLVEENLGANFELVQAHRCFVEGREYIHVILTGRRGGILSLVVTEKKNETFAGKDIQATVQASGIAIYGDRMDGMEVAAFESPRFLAYVVSDLSSDVNMQVATSIAPSLHAFLARTGA